MFVPRFLMSIRMTLDTIDDNAIASAQADGRRCPWRRGIHRPCLSFANSERATELNMREDLPDTDFSLLLFPILPSFPCLVSPTPPTRYSRHFTRTSPLLAFAFLCFAIIRTHNRTRSCSPSFTGTRPSRRSLRHRRCPQTLHSLSTHS